MTWSADDVDFTADSTQYTADGSSPGSITSAPYTARITSEHNQKAEYMAMVGLVSGAIGDITALIQSIPTAFDLDTAIGAQLDIIGLWVGQARVVTNVLLTGFFGFLDQSPPDLTMGEQTNPSIGGVFYELGATYQETTTLSDNDYRTILRARIVRNQSNGTIFAIENALEYIFEVPCLLHDVGDLSLAIVVSAPITQVQQALLNTLDLLPRPAGVAIGSITYSPL